VISGTMYTHIFRHGLFFVATSPDSCCPLQILDLLTRSDPVALLKLNSNFIQKKRDAVWMSYQGFQCKFSTKVKLRAAFERMILLHRLE